MSYPARGPIVLMGIDGKANAAGRRRHWAGVRMVGSEAAA
jgi:hypothetical protein